jgi:hypothetical protein
MKKSNTIIDPIQNVENALEYGMDKLEKFIQSVFVKLENEGKKRVITREETKKQKEEIAYVYSSEQFSKAEQKAIVKQYQTLHLAHEKDEVKCKRMQNLAKIRAKQKNKNRNKIR